MTEASFLARIQIALGTVAAVKPPEDATKKGNVASVLAECFRWKQVEKHAEGKYKKALEELKAMSDTPEKPGEYTINHSNHFAAVLNVSEPVKRLDLDVLAEKLNKSKWRVPRHEAKALIEASRVATTSVHKYVISEVV